MKSLIKQLFLKAGFTVLKGDIRKSVQSQPYSLVLPSYLLQNSRVAASRADVLKTLPKGGTVVEVGVGYGDFTRMLLEELLPDRFIAIDSFEIASGDEPWGRTTLADKNISHQQHYRELFIDHINSGRMELRKGLSWDMLAELPDESIDYIYVDADHSYDAVVKDIQALTPKMKKNGIIQFNDYTRFDQYALMPYGVPNAVHEFMIANDYEMLWLCLHPMGFYDVVVRKRNA